MKTKICPECRSKMEIKRTTLHFEREKFYADIENVCSFICPNCGTRSIPADVAKSITDTVEHLFKSAKEPIFTGLSFQKIAV